MKNRSCDTACPSSRMMSNLIDIGEDQFVALRTARDATLSMPKLIIPSIQINMKAGQLPDPDDSGTRSPRCRITLSM